VVVEFPVPLLNRAEEVAAGMNRSDFIRRAVEQAVERGVKERLERELADGYIANAEQARRACEDFSALDSEAV
jgi:metal-responsive CopG/Arc/MetJ family transcriptional regulator